MANYKINRNKPEPTEEQIHKKMDFQQLINKQQEITQYKKATKPLYKNPGFLSFVVVVSVILLTIFIIENESTPTKENKETKSAISNDSIKKEETELQPETIHVTQDSIQSQKRITNSEAIVIPASKPDYKQTINIADGGIIYFGSTRILVPPYAFVDSKGNPVKESVEISYKEYRDPVSIAFASIPMHYDSAQKNMQLISAGMFDIRGFANNQPVQLAKPIQVELASSQHSNYNLYYLNQAKNEWEFISKENKSYRFKVVGNESTSKELLPFEALEWEFKPENAKQLADFNLLFSKEWYQFILEEELRPDYASKIKFKRLASEQSIKASPVKLTANNELNRQLLQAKYTLYKENLKKKQRNQQLYKEAMQRQQAWLESFEGKKYTEWLKGPEGVQHLMAMKVISVFTINKFGIWNCDTPSNLPAEAKVEATFKDTKGNSLDLNEIRLVDYSKNTVYTYYKGHPIQFNPKAENILWATMPGGKLAVFTKENFKTIPSGGNVTFVMNVIDIKGKTEEEIKELLAMKNHITSKEVEKEKNRVANYPRVVVITSANEDVIYTGQNTAINPNGILLEDQEETSISDERIIAEQERIKKEAEEKAKKAAEEARKKAVEDAKRNLQGFDQP